MENSLYEERLNSIRKKLVPNHLDGILFSSLENIRYLCGFTGSDGAFVITEKESFFLTDSRYWTQADEEVRGLAAMDPGGASDIFVGIAF